MFSYLLGVSYQIGSGGWLHDECCAVINSVHLPTPLSPPQQIIYILKRKHYPMTSTGTEGTVGAVRRLIKKNQNARTMDPVGDEDDAQQYLNVMKAINVSAQ